MAASQLCDKTDPTLLTWKELKEVGEDPWSALTSCLAMASSLTIWRILKKLWPYPELLKRDAMMMPQTLHSEKLKEGSFSGVKPFLIYFTQNVNIVYTRK